MKSDAVRTGDFINQLMPMQRGASYPAVTDEDVFGSEIPLPYPNALARSPAERQRIAQMEQAILTAAFRGEL